jgi:hypothetical protein
MSNNTTWTEIVVTLAAGVFLLLIAALIVAFANPSIEHQCASKGGQVLARPGHLSSCLYPAK